MAGGYAICCGIFHDFTGACWGGRAQEARARHDAANAVAVDAGWEFNCFLISAGNAECSGHEGRAGSVLDGYQGGDAIDIGAGRSTAGVLTEDGHVVIWGPGLGNRYVVSENPYAP